MVWKIVLNVVFLQSLLIGAVYLEMLRDEKFFNGSNNILSQHGFSLVITSHQLQVINKPLSDRVLKFSSSFVANPNVNTSSPRKNIHKVVKIVILLQCSSDYFNRTNQQLPAFQAYLFSLTAVSNVIIVIHIKIKNKLSLFGFSGRVFFGNLTPDSSCIHLYWDLLTSRCHSFLHFLGIVKHNISLNYVSLVLKRELSMVQRTFSIVSKPFCYSFIRIKILIVQIKTFHSRYSIGGKIQQLQSAKIQNIIINRMDIEYNAANKKVAYFYNPIISKFVYAKQHPMRPERIAMAHNLIVNTGLYKKLDAYHARHASKQEMNRFHSEQYINYLEQYVSKDISNKFNSFGIDKFVLPQNQQICVQFLQKKQKFKVGQSTDCPAFNGLYNYCQISSGASIDSAVLLLNGQADIAINFGGGLHHAKKSQASGFCYVNDIVLAILQLLLVYPRVIYVDIDVHHGDGVQQAFYLSNRVMSVSFHQYGEDFFPGTGSLHENGEYDGKHYALNVPLKPGMDDDSFYELFKDIMQGVMAKYRPHAILMQLGADSLCHDKLGGFNLSLRGHGRCLKHMLSYNIPTIMVGGGGYTPQNVSRCWAYETGLALGQQLDGPIPKNDIYYHRYNFDQKIHFPVKNIENKNSVQDLNNLRQVLYSKIRQIESAPGYQIHHQPQIIRPWRSLNQEDTEDQQSYW